MESDGVGQASASPAWAAPDVPSEPSSSELTPLGLSSERVTSFVDDPFAEDPTDAAVDDRPVADVEPPAPPVPLIPLTISDLVDGAYNVVKRSPVRVLGSVAVLVIPIRLLAAYAQRESLGDYAFSNLLTNPRMLDTAPNLRGGEVLLLLLSSLLDSLALFFIGGVVSSFVVAWFEGRDLTARQALGASLRRGWAFLAAWALLEPVKLVSYAACILPVFVTVTFFCLTAPAIFVEGLGPIAGIKRSATLVARRFWPVLWIVVVSSFVAWCAGRMLGVVPGWLAQLLPSPFDWIGTAVTRAMAEIVATTALVATCVLVYFDLRVRSEGFDLSHRRAAVFDGEPER